jgi:KipI family sensor histidine kinase inhibitor
MQLELMPLGDRAIQAVFTTESDASRWAATVRARNLRGVTDVVLAYRSAAVFVDPDRGDMAAVERELAAIEPGSAASASGKLVTIPVLYDGPDLQPAAHRLGLGMARMIELHASVDYDVFAIGFLPGFPYAGYLPAELCGLARLGEPRLRVPVGAVAIAGRQTGIYPRESPGGWHLLGRTPLRIADADSGYFPIRAGDRIRFRPIGAGEFEAKRDERL